MTSRELAKLEEAFEKNTTVVRRGTEIHDLVTRLVAENAALQESANAAPRGQAVPALAAVRFWEDLSRLAYGT